MVFRSPLLGGGGRSWFSCLGEKLLNVMWDLTCFADTGWCCIAWKCFSPCVNCGEDSLHVGGVVAVEHVVVQVLQHVSLVQLVQVWAIEVLPALMQGGLGCQFPSGCMSWHLLVLQVKAFVRYFLHTFQSVSGGHDCLGHS